MVEVAMVDVAMVGLKSATSAVARLPRASTHHRPKLAPPA